MMYHERTVFGMLKPDPVTADAKAVEFRKVSCSRRMEPRNTA